jgi:hypothetical protein
MWIGSNSFACILIYLVRSMKATSLFPLALQISASILHKQEMTNSYMYPYLQGIVSHIMYAEGTHIVHKESISTSSWRLSYKIKQAVLVDPHCFFFETKYPCSDSKSEYFLLLLTRLYFVTFMQSTQTCH